MKVRLYQNEALAEAKNVHFMIHASFYNRHVRSSNDACCPECLAQQQFESIIFEESTMIARRIIEQIRIKQRFRSNQGLCIAIVSWGFHERHFRHPVTAAARCSV